MVGYRSGGWGETGYLIDLTVALSSTNATIKFMQCITKVRQNDINIINPVYGGIQIVIIITIR